MAKIVGGTASTPMVIPDWEQNNPLKADYIKNKPFVPKIDNEAVSNDIWSSKTIADRFCLPFTEKGNVVTCNPVEGYPMEVVTEGTAITRCGENLWNFKADVERVTPTTKADGTTASFWGYAVHLPPGAYTLHTERVSGTSARYIYGDINSADGSYKKSVDTYTATNATTQKFTLEEGDVLYVYNGNGSSDESTSNGFFKNQFNVQIEMGSVATAYKPYRGGTFTATPSSTIVPAIDGLNIIFANNGEVTVSGRIDPKHLYTMLTSLAAE